MTTNKHLQKEKSNRIVLFADMRDSTDIPVYFDQKIYQKAAGQTKRAFWSNLPRKVFSTKFFRPLKGSMPFYSIRAE